MALKKVGQTLEWSSQSGGFWVKKQGKVVAIARPGERITDALLKRYGVVPLSRIKAGNLGRNERYVVEVQRKTKEPVNAKQQRDARVDFYAPLVSTIDNKLAKAKKAPRLRQRTRSR